MPIPSGVTTANLVALSQTIWASVGGGVSRNFHDAGKQARLHTGFTTTDLVALGQTVWVSVGGSQKIMVHLAHAPLE